jgi:hypothetical protein
MNTQELPKAIGSYRIQAQLGQGGMGVVFKGVHETLERPAAVKLLPPELAQNPEYVSRFLREARVLAALRHDHIVQVYDAGAFESKYYIAMELVEGSSLASYIEQKKVLDEKEGVELLYQAARGLAAAHAQGLVHRDIKPENLLLDRECRVRIVDFGLVMESASTTQLTATGACLGTPMYMSPEQADGEKADARSDLYSLGVTFFRVLTGQPPFISATVMNLLFKHKFEAPPDPRKLKPELSEGIANLLLRLMAKRREDRPQTAQEVVELIDGYRQGRRIPPPPPFRSPLEDAKTVVATSTPGSSSTPERAARRAMWAGLATGLLVLLLGGLAAYFFLGRGTPQGTPGAPGTTPTATPGTTPATPERPTGLNVDGLLARIDSLIREKYDADAFALLAAGLRELPQDPRLRQLKAGLESMQACEAVCRGLTPILAQGRTVATDARNVDSDDELAPKLQDTFAAKVRECDERASQARDRFLAHAYDTVHTMVAEAKTLALLASADFQSAYERYDKKAKEAAEFKGLNTGIFRIGVKGNKEKAEKYARIAESFSGLTQQARTLSQ